MILDRYAIKDVTMLQLGTQSEAEIALRRGIVDGAMVSPPQSFLLIRDGFRELVSAQDYSKFTGRLISGGIAARRSWAVKNRRHRDAHDQGGARRHQSNHRTRKPRQENPRQIHPAKPAGNPRPALKIRSGHLRPRSGHAA